MINARCLPSDCQECSINNRTTMRTTAGSFQPRSVVWIRGMRLPEFNKNLIIEEQKAFVFDSTCRYDVILGADFMNKIGMDILFSTAMVRWLGIEIPMRVPFSRDDEMEVFQDYECQTDDDYFGGDYNNWLDEYATPILDAKYGKADIDTVIAEQTHLTKAQKNDLHAVLSNHEKLFNGELGLYPHKKVHIYVDQDAIPVHARPYPVPHLHLETFKRELDHSCAIGVLSKQGASEWASSSFIVPKKDGRVRWISDLRALNKVIKRKQYPLPIIMDILRKRLGYKFFTKLDISMQYYTFELDDEAKELCTIVTPFGKYKYEHLPMGLKCAPDIAQEVMETVLHDIEDQEIYIDDAGAFSMDWNSHMALLERILSRLKDNGFTINPLKCEWAVQETDWLGYWLTPTGLKPWQKKVDAIMKMQRPSSLKEMRTFIGAFNYYRDLWP